MIGEQFLYPLPHGTVIELVDFKGGQPRIVGRQIWLCTGIVDAALWFWNLEDWEVE